MKTITLRLKLFMFYASMALLSVLSPRHGRQLIVDAEEAIARRRAATPK